MKHTECKDCELSKGDCGYHFKMDGVTNYDIASLSACDKYGNCMFFKAKAKLQGDLISREALKKAFEDTVCIEPMPYAFVKQIIDNAPTVEPFEPDYVGAERLKARQRGYEDGYHNGMKIGKTLNPKIKQGEWIPIKTRELTEEEKEEYPDCTFMYDCKLPEDGEEVLVTTWYGGTALDTFCRDDGCYFENYCDEGDVIAWMPKPEPYKEGGAE